MDFLILPGTSYGCKRNFDKRVREENTRIASYFGCWKTGESYLSRMDAQTGKTL